MRTATMILLTMVACWFAYRAGLANGRKEGRVLRRLEHLGETLRGDRPVHLVRTENWGLRTAWCGETEWENGRLDMTIDPADSTCTDCLENSR